MNNLIDKGKVADKMNDLLFDNYPNPSEELETFYKEVLKIVVNEEGQPWVSICDDLPPEGTTVLILDKLGRLYFDKWNGSGWRLSERGTIDFWINIPEPPESEDDAE